MEELEPRAEYTEHKPNWETIKDCTKGELAIKKKKETYLPFPVPIDNETRETEEFHNEYEVYLSGAHFTDYTSQAVEDLAAGIFRVAPAMENLPEPLEYLDINGLAKELVVLGTTYGRGFSLCDYPVTKQQPTLADEEDKGISAFFRTYEALDILNWDTKQEGATDILTRVLLLEKYYGTTESDDTEELRTRYRELLLVDGVYTVRLWDEDEKRIGEDMIPKANGKIMDYIPGMFIGINGNTTKVDKSPVLGIANTNIKHYQTWGELMHVQTYMGHPTLNITGAPDGFVKKMKEENIKVTIGASKALVFEGEKAAAAILQINGDNLIHFNTLTELKQSMMDQGARLRSQKTGSAETAEAVKLRNASDISIMASVAVNTEEVVEFMVKCAGDFMGSPVPDTFNYVLNKLFVEENPDPQILAGLSSLAAAQQVPLRILYGYMKQTGLMDEAEDTEALLEEAKQGGGDFATPPTVPEAPVIEE